MKYMQVGKTDMQASVFTLGAMGMGGGSRFPDTNDAESIRTIHAALDAGINIIDTAPVYGFGHSEEVIGKAIQGRRDKVLIATKCGLWWDDDEGAYRFTWDEHAVKRNVSRRTIMVEVEKSLARLGTDYIDIYYTHNPAMEPFLTPIEETIDALLELKKQGKIRAIGASNCEVHHIESYLQRGELSFVQREYSMLQRAPEEEILPLCEKEQVSFHAYSPLCQGLLTGNFARDYLPDTKARQEQPNWSAERYPVIHDFVDSLRDIAAGYNCSLSSLAIAFLRSAHPNVNVILGLRKEKHLQENVQAAELAIKAADAEEIRRRLARAGL